ncbi:hypothetical protein CEXT_264671 [Caerostris extrusa]|uniref:Uncharacterized protein n=1 Tax=Caerostris extrusa TaxID=172846 RepID=A0AAV4PNL0_CAEEX|nr:hypothetical protein CEXT_264671 [Caerostris extrusa]
MSIGEKTICYKYDLQIRPSALATAKKRNGKGKKNNAGSFLVTERLTSRRYFILLEGSQELSLIVPRCRGAADLATPHCCKDPVENKEKARQAK